MSLSPDTIFKSTLARLVAGAAAVFAAGWYMHTQVDSIVSEVKSVKAEQASQRMEIADINRKLDQQFITWPIARLYAADFRHENRNLPLVVPDVNKYRDADSNRRQ